MNDLYRNVWNEQLGAWVAAAETAKSLGHGGSRQSIGGKARFKLSTLAAAILVAGLQMTASDAGASTYSNFAPSNGCVSTTKATIGQATVTGTNAQPVDGTGTWSNILGCDTSGNGLDAVSVFGTYSQGVGHGAAVFGFHGTAGQWASAFGLSANAAGAASTALGFGARAQSLNSVAIGGAGGDGTTVLSPANSTTASGAGAIAIGSNAVKGAQAAASDSIALGGQSSVAGTAASGVAIGLAAKASGSQAVALGAETNAAGENTVALGNKAAASYDGSVALGADSKTADSLAALKSVAAYTPSAGAAVAGTTPAGEVSVGSSGNERRLTNLAAGAAPTDAVNVSQLSTATSSLSSSLSTTNSNLASLSTTVTDGLSAANSNINKLSAGLSTVSGTVDSLVAGLSTTTGGIGSLSSGLSTTNSNLASLSTSTSTALGTTNRNVGSLSSSVNTIYSTGTKYFHTNSTAGDSMATGQRAVAIGAQSVASGANAFAAGSDAKALADGAVAMGSSAQATGQNAIAIGTGALAAGSQAIGVNSRAGGGGAALGDGADAGGTPLSRAQNVSKGTAIGFGALVQQSGGVALGANSVASTAAGVPGYVPGNATAQNQAAVRATTSTQAAVSVGDAANRQYRQITGVAAGAADSDAANVAQLKAAAEAAKASSTQYETNPDGSVNYSQVTLGAGQAPGGTRIGNVAPGVRPTDAVNMNQLNQVKSQVGDVARIAYSGTAMAFAMSGTYLPTLSAGEKTVGVGLGSYKGYSAVALTFKALSEDGRTSWGGGLSTTGKEWGLNAGVGWKWK
jgi:Coiled stalk of trimeric autotransporter adhesin/Extended Signal Peptide of Type V secretion system/YadA-like membrane anchor domain/Head domain of trimeric autotransporter adhesin